MTHADRPACTGDVTQDVVRAHDWSLLNRPELEASATAGCFCCRAILDPRAITTWVDGGQTALCPRCGIDAVVPGAAGFALTPEFLAALHAHWFDWPADGAGGVESD